MYITEMHNTLVQYIVMWHIDAKYQSFKIVSVLSRVALYEQDMIRTQDRPPTPPLSALVNVVAEKRIPRENIRETGLLL